MYTIMMNENKALVTTNRVTLYEKESNVDTIRFLIPQIYKESEKEIDMSKYVVVLKYILPDKTPMAELLTLEEELYKNMLDYRLKIDTDITKMHGEVEVRLSFLDSYTDESGNHVDEAMHSGSTYIEIRERVDAYAMCNNSLEILDQYVLKMREAEKRVEEKLKDINDIADNLADDVELVDGQIWARNKENLIGTPIDVKDIKTEDNKWDEF